VARRAQVEAVAVQQQAREPVALVSGWSPRMLRLLIPSRAEWVYDSRASSFCVE